METQRKEILSQAVQYFSQPGFKRLIEGMVEKYRSLGHWGGTVNLPGLKEEEREALMGFFGKDFSYQKSASISLASFAKALEQTRFRELSPLELLEAIMNEPLLSKKEEYLQKEESRQAFFQELLDLYPDEFCQEWLKAILTKKPGTRAVHQAYEQDPGNLKQQMLYILKALQTLQERLTNQAEQVGKSGLVSKGGQFDQVGQMAEVCQVSKLGKVSQVGQVGVVGKVDEVGQAGEVDQAGETGQVARERLFVIERLPVFARRITHDPHSFDPNRDTGRLLLHALRYLKEHTLPNYAREPELFFEEEFGEAEELTQLYYSFGLIRDDVWNFVTCTGIKAPDNVGYLEQAYREGVVLNLPLKEVVKLGRVFPGNPLMDRVYVVENPSVFSSLLDLFEEYCGERGLEALPNPPLICTHGHFKLSGLILLDKLAANSMKIYYSGDFDPEGLLMLDKLKQRYGDLLVPWHYQIEDYQACIYKQELNSTRMKKLDKIQSPELRDLKEALKQTHYPGYQEGLLDALWEDIRLTYF